MRGFAGGRGMCRKEVLFFKKEPKTFIPLRTLPASPTKYQKFFDSFFQKKKAFLILTSR